MNEKEFLEIEAKCYFTRNLIDSVIHPRVNYDIYLHLRGMIDELQDIVREQYHKLNRGLIAIQEDASVDDVKQDPEYSTEEISEQMLKMQADRDNWRRRAEAAEKQVEDARILKLHYDNLSKHFNALVSAALGQDYYNLGADGYTCDQLCCEDLARSMGKKVAKRYSKLRDESKEENE